MKYNRSLIRGESITRVLSFALLAMALVVATSSSLWAQGQGQGRRMGQVDIDSLVADLTEQLDLTEKQAVQLKPVLEKQYSGMRELMMAARQSGDRSTVQPKMAQLREQHHAEVAKILTEDQLKKYQEIQESSRRGGMGRRPGG